MDLDEVEDDIYRGKYRFDTADKRQLATPKAISQVWPQSPSKNQLHIYVTLPKPNIGSPTLVDADGEFFMWHHLISEYLMNTPAEGGPIGHHSALQPYEHIFMKLKKYGVSREPDIERNQIYDAETSIVKLPEYVSTFEQGLARKPLLHPEVRCFLDLSLCGSILTGQRRCCMLHRFSPTPDPILVFSGTRSPETDPTGKHAMLAHGRCMLHGMFRFTIGKRVGKGTRTRDTP